MHFIAATAVLLKPSQLWQKMAPKRRNRPVARTPPRCQHPGCNRPAEPVEGPVRECPHCGREEPVNSLDCLDLMDEVPLIAISRDERLFAVGKFSAEALDQLCRPGDKLLSQAGEIVEFRGRAPFQGEWHRL